MTTDALPEQEHSAPAPRRASWAQLLVALAIWVAVSFGVLVVAGELGAAGVVIGALVEAAAIALLYRWCEA